MSAKPREVRPTFTVDQKDLPNNPTLIVYGDMRFTDPSNTTVANPTARKLLVERIATEHPDAIQLTGDVPYAGNNPEDYKVYAAETSPWREESLRVYPALGNHELVGKDRAEDLNRWWNTFPELNGLRWYSVALGQRVLLISLDSNSNLLPGSEQRRWLEKQLERLDRKFDFVLIALHHPPVADIQTHIEVDHNPRPNEISLRDYLSAISKICHARLIVAAGHIHNYERFEKDGVTYLVSGGGGARPYIVERTAQDLYQADEFPNFHYIKFTLSRNEMKATMFRLSDADGRKPMWQAKDAFTVKSK